MFWDFEVFGTVIVIEKGTTFSSKMREINFAPD